MVSSLDDATRTQWLTRLTTKQQAALRYNWLFWARDKQLIPDELLTAIDERGEYIYNIWLILAGRGFGKTRTGAEAVRWLVEYCGYQHIAIVGRTAGDVRDVMIEGPSGLLSVYPPWEQPVYEPSKRRVTFPNGAIATTYSADEPDQLRGPNTDLVWGDEIAAWRFPDAFDQIGLGNRIGEHPLQIYTTTPRPTPLIKELVKSPEVLVTKGTTYENTANLARSFFQRVTKKYSGTTLGRQELLAEILDDTEGALWKRKLIEDHRVTKTPELVRIVVAIDPAASASEDSSETGIVVAGIDRGGGGYVLEDVSLKDVPIKWARQAISAYYKYKADRIVGEKNNGGDMVEAVIRSVDKDVSFRAVWASRGKQTRAEPVSALYEQGRVFHVGAFAELEDQMCTWIPGDKSPDRLDSLVWALTELMLGDSEGPVVRRARAKFRD